MSYDMGLVKVMLMGSSDSVPRAGPKMKMFVSSYMRHHLIG